MHADAEQRRRASRAASSSDRRDRARARAARSRRARRGHAWLNVDGGMMSPRCTLMQRLILVLAANSGRAVSSSCAITPAANSRCARRARLPEIASGAMYASLPLTRPVCVRSCDDCAFAMPKSITLRCPRCVTSKFDGETSRCTIPSGWPSLVDRACARSRARRTAGCSSPTRDVDRRRPGDLARVAEDPRTSRPSMYSIEMKY